MTIPLLVIVVAAADPTWTDKELFTAIGSTITVAIGVFTSVGLWLINRAIEPYKTRTRKAEAERDVAIAEKTKIETEIRKEMAVEIERLRKELANSQTRIEAVRAETEAARQAKVKAESQLLHAQVVAKKAVKEVERYAEANGQVSEEAEKLKAELADTAEKLEEHQIELASVQKLIKKTTEKDGQTWNEKVPASAPDFKPLGLGGRQMPVISVLNLKGGVGKTTVAANLGAAFDGRGYQTLLIDLDLQGSLTGLFLQEPTQKELQENHKLLEDFLNASFDAEYPNILDYTQPILSGKSGLVATSDTLTYAETNLTLRWMLRDSNRDARFLLRRELHLKRITKTYDVVVLDCPPILNMCCVNALAASDYLLIPIVPSKQATARVPVLLNRLGELRENINPDLKVIGVLTNRTARSELTVEESNRLTQLRQQCKDVWGTDVPILDTFIRQGAEIRAAEDEYRTLRSTDVMYQHFAELAVEIEKRLPTFCLPGSGKAAQEVSA